MFIKKKSKQSGDGETLILSEIRHGRRTSRKAELMKWREAELMKWRGVE